MRSITVIAAMLLIMIWTPMLCATESRGIGVIIRDMAGKEVGLYENSYALVIGVSEYTNGLPNLPGVKKDVAEVAEALEEHGFQVKLVENPADRGALDQVFTNFINRYGQKEDDRLLFYFSGHGHTLRTTYGSEMGFIVPAGAPNPNQDLEGFRAKALDMQMIEVYAKRIQSKHALFVFDSCFSGSIFSLSKAIPENINYKTAEHVRQFITSGSADEQVPDDGVFRQQFVEALQGEADWDDDGYVTGQELGEFLQKNIINYSNNTQHPQYGKIRDPLLDKGDFVFQLPVATVTVRSSPSEAAIYVDGDEVTGMKTPATLKLSAGEYSLEVDKPPLYRRSDPQSMKLQVGVNEDIIVPLEEKMGLLDINSRPAGATIRINRELTDKVTPTSLSKPPGRYTITIEHEDHDPYTEEITLADRQTLKIDAVLPTQTQLYIISKPPGCRIDLGELGIHQTPAWLRRVKPGDYEARATMRGYKDVKRSFTVAPQTRNTFEIQLFPVSRVDMAWRSLLLPGWGQYYGGRYSTGTTFLLAGVGAAAGAAGGYLSYDSAVDEYNRSVVRYNDAFNPHEFGSAKEAMMDAYDKADSRFVLRQAMFITAGVVWGINMAHVLITGPLEAEETPQAQVDLPRLRMVPRISPRSVGVTLAYPF
ncbi:PEGA domain-containing protein [Candidatus Poribacteria bacterium]